MRKTQFFVSICSGILVTQGLNTPVIAGDYAFMLMSEAYQDAVAIGTVKEHRDQTLLFSPTRTLIGDRLPKVLAVHIGSTHVKERFQDGEAIVITLKQAQGVYQLNSPVFKVSSSNPSQAVVLSGPLQADSRFMFQRMINSCGQDRQFSFDGQTIFLQKFNQQEHRFREQIPIGIKEGSQYVALEENVPRCPSPQKSLWQRFVWLFHRVTKLSLSLK